MLCDILGFAILSLNTKVRENRNFKHYYLSTMILHLQTYKLSKKAFCKMSIKFTLQLSVFPVSTCVIHHRQLPPTQQEGKQKYSTLFFCRTKLKHGDDIKIG